MARIRNGILGGFSNKVGEVIGQNYAGISTMRAMPKYVTNPRTPAQIAHRQKMSIAGSFLSAFNRGLEFSLWNKSAVNNAFNNALKYNFDKFVNNNNLGYQPDLLNLDLGTYVGEPLFGCQVTDCVLDTDYNFLECSFEWNEKEETPWTSNEDTIILFAVSSPAEGVYIPLYCEVLECVRGDAEGSIVIAVGDRVKVGDYVYFAFCCVAACCIIPTHNPQKPTEIIKIPAKNICKSIPAKNVVRFSAGATLKKAVSAK